MRFREQIGEALAELEGLGLLRRPRRVSGPQGPEIEVDGRRVLCFCSNNYLGLADHPELARAARGEDGFGAAASRLITGSMDAHHETEEALAAFVRAPTAALFANGYAANVGSVQALVGAGDQVFSDALNHASLIDGCRLSRAQVHVYRHRDLDHLEQLLRQHATEAGRALIVTDSLFSMDGVFAPIEALAELAHQHGAGLMIDEAHSLGVFGPEGSGVCAAMGVVPDALVGTLGKSFGGAGAFVAGSHEIVSVIRNQARSYVFSTAPPPPVVRAAGRAIDLVRAASEERAALLAHSARLREELNQLGFEVPPGTSQIIPILIGDKARAMRLSASLFDRGVFVQGIRPPTVAPGTSRLRLTPMASHSDDHLDRALAAFAALAPTG
ncbi:MAG: 8-amino-7-oxononanoate synthase [Myxococcota bacterium]